MRFKTTALLALLLSSAGAMAQSSVTMYGRVDLSGETIDNGVRQYRLSSGVYTSSRLGFRGTEDLGGGMQALFLLEAGIFADTGQLQGGARMFNRGSYVGLGDSKLGVITAGRQYVPIFWPFLYADEAGPLRLHSYSAVQSIQRSNTLRVNPAALKVPVANSTIGTTAGGIYTVGISSAFENNMLVYRTPTLLNGLTVSLAAAPGESYTDGAYRIYGANVEYRNGPLYAGGGWTQKTGPQLANGSKQQISEGLASAMYSVTKEFKLWGNVHPWKFETGAGGASVDGNDFMLGASYWFPLGELWANYGKKNISSCNNCGTDGFGVGYHYTLSKRSELYVSYGSVSNEANSFNGLNGVAPLKSGTSVNGFAVGVAHVF